MSAPPAREIPSTFTASVRSWWSAGEKQSAASEQRLLRRLKGATSSRVELPTPNHFINTVSFLPSSPPTPLSPPPAVLLHGYGAGLGFFFQNLPVLAQWADKRNTSVYALDWLGMGRSARVPFVIKSKRDDIPNRVHEAEQFFVSSLESWRQRMAIPKMTLIAHSLGAYLSVVYALNYPERVSKLILLSPAGVPRGPGDLTAPAREVDAEPEAGVGGKAEEATHGKVDQIRGEQQELKAKESKTRRLLMYLWEEGWSPFQVVRNLGVWGPMLIGKYSARRFSTLTPEETRDMHDYILNITLAKGSGEYCISHILAPGAHARLPLVDRISPLKIPVVFIYGDHDWMDPAGGEQSVENLRKAGNGNGRMYIVNNAGHHVYLDNVKAVNDLLVKELDRKERVSSPSVDSPAADSKITPISRESSTSPSRLTSSEPESAQPPSSIHPTPA